MADASQGAQARLLAKETTAAWDNTSEAYEFYEEDLKRTARIIGSNGITGSRSSRVERTRYGAYAVDGPIQMKASPNDLEKWLKRAMGAASLPNVTLAETIPAFDVLIDRVAKVFDYQDCYINQFIMKGKSGPDDAEPELIDMILAIYAKDELTTTTWPAVPPTLGTGGDDAPFIFSDLTLSVGGTSRCAMEFALMIDNKLDRRWCNSLTATSITPTAREVRLRVTSPFTADELDLYNIALAGMAGVLTLTNGTVNAVFTFGKLQLASVSPTVKGKVEIPLVLDFVARKVGTTPELAVTIDSTV